MIGRRHFMTLASGAVAAWPLAARAQQPAMPVIGLLSSGSPGPAAAGGLAAFRQGLRQAGYVEGQNVTIEYRWAEDQNERLATMAADLVSRSVSVIAALGGVRSALAAKALTTKIPIVFVTGGDPVALGLVASLNRPGGNVTGATALGNVLVAKLLQLLHELLPKVDAIGFLVNPDNPNTESDTTMLQAAAHTIGIQVDVINARNERDFDSVFENVVQRQMRALIISTEALFNGRSAELAALALRSSIPTIQSRREFAVSGGLISYGASSDDMARQAALYVGRILKGETPVNLPVLQSTKFDLVINLKTAKTLGLTVPPNLLAIAAEVIE
jgi:putative ABC transport system substrate-binding protein